MVAAVQFHTYTVEEFLNLELPEGKEYELVNGIITPMSEPSGNHENLRSGLRSFGASVRKSRLETQEKIHR